MSSAQNKYACEKTTNLSFFVEEIFDHLSGVKNLLSLTEIQVSIIAPEAMPDGHLLITPWTPGVSNPNLATLR